MRDSLFDLPDTAPKMKNLISELYLTNRAFITDEYDECLSYIDENWLDLDIHKFSSGNKIWNSWVIPNKWSVDHAYIETDGERLLEYDDHPLHVISYSSSHEGTLSRNELLKHIHTHPDNPAAIPYHFRLNYRPWESEWGFCASQDFVDTLSDREYYVSIDTTFSKGELKVAEHTIEGKSDKTVILAAHLDHTGMANDDLSGVAVGVEIMRRLRRCGNLRYSYKLLLIPEMLGTAAYLERFADSADDFEFGIFLEMLGNENRPLLQQSFTSETKLDDIAIAVLERSFEDSIVKEFRQEIGNDELIFEGPGFEIPTISISRFPYPEYHTHLDDITIISEAKLRESAKYVLKIIDILERDFVPYRTFDGIPSLANPKYDLYIDPGQAQLNDSTDNSENVRTFSNRVFRYLDGNATAFEIADEFDLEFDFVAKYLRLWESNGLIKVKNPI